MTTYMILRINHCAPRLTAESLPAKNLGLKEDGLLYIIGNGKLNFIESVSWCKKIPGFRLAIFKSVIQYPMAMNIAAEEGNVHLNLH